MITSIIFSKNRPLQLDLCLNSIKQNFPQSTQNIVLHNNSVEFGKAHLDIKKEHSDVEFWQQTESLFCDIWEAVKSAKNDYICFFVSEESRAGIEEISPVRSFHHYTPSVDEIFDWLWSNFSSLDQPKSGRVENLTMEVPLTSEQARTGGNARVMVPVHSICPACRGFGNIGMYSCSRCAGEGAISGEMPIVVSFPPGLTEDHAVMVPLDRFGIRNIHLVVLFRPTGEAGQ